MFFFKCFSYLKQLQLNNFHKSLILPSKVQHKQLLYNKENFVFKHQNSYYITKEDFFIFSITESSFALM